MPGKIKVKVLAGRNLPVMDRASDTTDAFVEIKFGGVTLKTDVCRKSLNPHWNSTEWYRFEVDESELQDEPLQLRLMDHDTYSANDAIGKVVISLAPLLAREAQATKGGTAPHSGAVMSGWIPVFDTMHGIRGELNVIVKVELFADFNKYKTSSVGVQFFHCSQIPPGYRATAIHGFVEELVVNDDPEYQWIDKIRTPRASNEARQVAFIKLSNQVQRLVGLKAAELGANAVIGYQQDFDLEGEAGVVARAIGTAVSISPLPTLSQPPTTPACTQQQLKKYLGILSADNDAISDQYEYYKTHQDELEKLVHIMHPNKSSNFLDDDNDDESPSMLLSRQSSVKSYTDKVSIFQDDFVSQNSFRTISEDQTELNRLLYKNQKDKGSKSEEDTDSDSSGPLQKIKKLKTNFFTKRLGSLRKNKQDKDDTVSIKSNSSDTSRISFNDIRKEIKKLKRIKKPKFIRNVKNFEDKGVGMASILARSVIHAHTSLQAIAETIDSEASPTGTMRRTSESDPALSIADEGKISPQIVTQLIDETDKERKEANTVASTSLGHLNVAEAKLNREIESCPSTPTAGRSENQLKLPGEIGYFGSLSSALSGDSSEMYSSSEEDDESSDKTDTERSYETTASVVQSVLQKQVNPEIAADMERKLSVIERIPKEEKAKGNETEMDNNKNENLEKTAGRASTSDDNEPFVVQKSHSHHHFKFHNPFNHKKSLSAPSSPVEKTSFVYRSSNRIKRQITKISKSSMIKSLSHYSLIPKRKHSEPKVMSQSGSGSDVPSKASSKAPSETVLGSPFLSFTDLLSLDKEPSDFTKMIHKEDQPHSKVEMYIGSEPASRASVSGPSSQFGKDDHLHEKHKKEKVEVKPTGMLHTAMETILMDKVQSLLIPTTPEPTALENQFFKDVNVKLEEVEEARSKSVEDKIEGECNRTKMGGPCNGTKRLTRQTSIHSESEIETRQSNSAPNLIITNTKSSTPMLQHFHPILSGVILPAIPSSQTSFNRSQSLDSDGVAEPINRVGVSDNTHAASAIVNRETRETREDRVSPRHSRHESYGRETGPAGGQTGPAGGQTGPAGGQTGPAGGQTGPAREGNSSLNASSTPVGMHRRSSDSDLSVTPKGSSLNASAGNTGTGGGAILRPSMNSNNLDLLEYPFLTMAEYPAGFIVHIGGCVCARSVKLVDGGGESAARAAWWAELRTEIRAHARALRCNAVVAYKETAAFCEDVCVLSASGTAVVINLDVDLNTDLDSSLTAHNGSKTAIEELEQDSCSVAHVPYSPGTGPLRAELSSCGGCRRARVPAVLLSTCAKPARLTSYGKAVTLTAVAGRLRRAPPQSEPGARDISDQLPFLEYELHKLLLAKLRMQGANAIFNVSTQIAIGERCVLAVASGTAVRLAALPAPTPPRIKASEKDKDAVEIQRALWDTFTANKTANGYDVVPPELTTTAPLPETEEFPVLELCADRDAALLELDEAEDVETARSLATRRMQMPVYSGAMKPLAAPPQAFVQVWRARLNMGSGCGLAAERHIARALDGLTYKLRLRPAALTPPTIHAELPEDEIQLVLSGTAIQLADPSKPDTNGHHGGRHGSHGSHGHGDDEIFALDEEQASSPRAQEAVEDKSAVANGQNGTVVSLTNLCVCHGALSVRRICALRLLFVRETTAVRELGGLSGFLHTFTCEVMAIARAYTAALGGNALTSFYITQLMLQDNAHKNQGQCLLSVGGDVVHATY